MDTIFALASTRGKSGVAVIRISGPDALQALSHFTNTAAARRPVLRRLVFEGEFLDEAVVITFPKPGSFTGEDVVELHVHGSVATVDALLSALGRIQGLRAARPGEFTRRALENERLDLTQVEGLADLIEAETEAQRKQALRVLAGKIGDQAALWRGDLVRASALLEATIDFSDEEVPTDVRPEVMSLLQRVRESLVRASEGQRAAERVRDGFEVAIVGPPNAGKSTLLNALTGREAAITSEIAGTTRDIVEVRMDIEGLPVTFLDTAGIHESNDVLEKVGISRARERASAADLRLILRPAGTAPIMTPIMDDLVLVPKSDLAEGDISARTGEGLDLLIESLGRIFGERVSSAGVIVRERHRIAVEDAIRQLNNVLDVLKHESMPSEMLAEDLRSVVRSLDSLMGQVGVEDLLDEVFSSFCIGK